MREFIKDLIRGLEEKEDFVISSVVFHQGSSPRGMGAKMLVSKDGLIKGSVGGGSVENASILKAKEVLAKKVSLQKEYFLRQNEIEDLGMLCGGDVAIRHSYIEANTNNLSFFKELDKIYDKEIKSLLFIELDKNEIKDFDFKVYLEDEKRFINNNSLSSDLEKVKEKVTRRFNNFDLEEKSIYAEKLISSEKVYVFGGGHVARALVPILDYVGFSSIVLEDREEFAKKEYFKHAKDVLLIDNKNIFSHINIKKEDYVCIMTRGHKWDFEILAQILKTKAKYIGVIGSKRKVAFINSTLKERGFSDKDIERFKSPIGLDIKAQTPNEIAISIVAELILVRANTYGN